MGISKGHTRYCPECKSSAYMFSKCVDCEQKFIRHSKLPLLKMLRTRYGLLLKDSKDLVEIIELLVLGYERRD